MTFSYSYKVKKYKLAVSEWVETRHPAELAVNTNNGKKMVIHGIIMKMNQDREVNVMNCECIRKSIRMDQFDLWAPKDQDCNLYNCATENCSNISCERCRKEANQTTYKCPFNCQISTQKNISRKKKRTKIIVEASEPIQRLQVISETIATPKEHVDIEKLLELNRKLYSRKRGRREGQKAGMTVKDHECPHVDNQGNYCGETNESWLRRHPNAKGKLKWIQHPEHPDI